VGETIEYTVTVRGEGARGISTAPDLSRVRGLPLGIQVGRRPDRVTVAPPAHSFVYRLRPTRAGQATLPPVAVSAFDVASGRYVTKVTAGIPLKVAEVPRFDPERIVDAAGEAEAERTGALRVAVVVVSVLSGGALTGAWGWLVVARRRSRLAWALQRLGIDLSRRLGRETDDAGLARALTLGLAAYLELTLGRPTGALTPVEAREGIAQATGSHELAERAYRLIERSDRVLYDTNRGAEDRLGMEASGFVRDLVAAEVQSGRRAAGRDGDGQV
jgi:hypothetical protein